MAGVDVSFIISVYHPNFAYFNEMIDSVLRLGKKSRCTTEICFRDDTDDGASAELLAKVAAENPDLIRIVPGGKNLGVGASRCELVKASGGRYVASFDQDDVMLPFDLDRAVKFLDDHPQYAASYSHKFLFNSLGLTGMIHGDWPSNFTMLFSPKMNINAMLIRREELIAHESFLPCPGSRINDDVFLMMRLSYDREIYFDIAEPRCLYRDHAEQYSKHLDKQADFEVMGEYFIARQPELYDRICREVEIPTSPENLPLVQAYSGLATFLLQRRDRARVLRICQRAAERDPHDYGAWEVLLTLSIGTPNFDARMAKACRLFAGNDWALHTFYRTAALRCQAEHRDGKPIFAEYNRLRKLLMTPPQWVVDSLPESARQKKFRYAFNLPPLKI